MIVELNKSISDNVRKKTLRWFKKDIGMTSEGLLQKLGGNHLSYWSGFLGGTRSFAKYEGYQRMAEAYGVSEDMFIRKMEEFIREDLGPPTVDADPEIAYATLARHNGISSEDLKKAIDIYKTLQR